MASREVNREAKINGKSSEKLIYSLLEKLFCKEDLNTLTNTVDFILFGKPGEIKSCKEHIKAPSNTRGTRHGNFNLTWEQHEYLCLNGGFYLFVLRKDSGELDLKFEYAEDIPFKRTLVWTRIFGNWHKHQ